MNPNTGELIKHIELPESYRQELKQGGFVPIPRRLQQKARRLMEQQQQVNLEDGSELAKFAAQIRANRKAKKRFEAQKKKLRKTAKVSKKKNRKRT